MPQGLGYVNKTLNFQYAQLEQSGYMYSYIYSYTTNMIVDHTLLCTQMHGTVVHVAMS